MLESSQVDKVEWLTPSQAVAVLAPHLPRFSDARAIELILDYATDGSIKSKDRRITVAVNSEVLVREDHAIAAGLWEAIRDGATYACWATGDFDAKFHVKAEG